MRELVRRVDVLVNISGLLADEALIGDIPLRAYLDLDPAFTQLWHAAEGIDMRFAAHNRFVTIGQAIGAPGCKVPTWGLEWVTTAQPIVLERWPPGRITTHEALTTVANWRGYGSIEHDGVFYGQKVHSWRRFFPLPTLCRERFAPALAIHPEEREDLATLRANGWHLIDPGRVSRTPAGYQGFVRGSRAEFGIAKSGYVASRCGWFSDRSVCYLASGRPVIAQETGFSRFLPVGAGLFTFGTIEEALASIEALDRDYDRHARAARAVAEEYFDSDRVLVRLLNVLGVS
jgi:hypothetical protein